MDKQAFIAHMKSVGWTLDKFGHLHKTVSKRLPHADYPIGSEPVVTRKYRIKNQDKTCRIEIQVTCMALFGDSTHKWVRLGGGYYTQIFDYLDIWTGNRKVRIGSFIY